jgi:hypothetical protein
MVQRINLHTFAKMQIFEWMPVVAQNNRPRQPAFDASQHSIPPRTLFVSLFSERSYAKTLRSFAEIPLVVGRYFPAPR